MFRVRYCLKKIKASLFGCEKSYPTERISKPSEGDNQASHFEKAVKERRIEFVANNETTKVVEPAIRSFNDPSSSVTTQLSTILGSWPNPVLTMGTDKIAVTLGQSLSKRIAVGRFVVNELVGNVRSPCTICYEGLNRPEAKRLLMSTKRRQRRSPEQVVKETRGCQYDAERGQGLGRFFFKRCD